MIPEPFDKPWGEGRAWPKSASRPRTGKSAGEGAHSGSQGVAESSQPGSRTEEIAEAKPKKAKLSNPRWEAKAIGFNEETPIAVDLELPRDIAHKTRVSFELFAKTPKGPEKISDGETNAKEGKAICSIPVYIPNYRDEDGNRPRRVEYFFTAKHSEAESLDGSKTIKVVEEMADLVLETHVVQHVTFATGKSFIRTSETAALKALGHAVKGWKSKHPDGKLAVFGHADALGEELANKQLSERRAKAVYAYLANDPKPWEELYGAETWGLAGVQEMLKHLGHDPGAFDGQDGPKTQAAVKEFQGKHALAATGTADAKTREALFLAYFEKAETPQASAKDFEAIDGKAFTGCSEFNLIENVNRASDANRRVAVLLLQVSKHFPIYYPCKQGAIMPCQKQAGLKGERRTPGFKCRFYDGLVMENKGATPKPVGKLKWTGLKDGDEVKQYVNLDPGKPGQGPERVFEVEIEGAPDGAQVFWKVYADPKNSKRNDPKPGLKAHAKGRLLEFKDGIAELETGTKGGKAYLVLACGLAGGDRFQVDAGSEKGKSEVSVILVNWRRLWYQLTYRKGVVPPSMSTSEKQLKDVFIEWVADKPVEHEIGTAGNIIIGNHNAAEFHKLLKSPHKGQCAHIILCDKQYDGLYGSSNITSTKSAEFITEKDSIRMSDPAHNIIVPNPVQQKGAKLLLSGTWKNHVTGKHGALTDDPSKVSKEIGLAEWHDDHWWRVSLPPNAKPTVFEPVTVTLKVTACSGPWAGDGGTAPHNIIVIDSDDTLHSQCCMHELGHIMNMVPLKGYYSHPPGFTRGDHTHAYEKMGGSGSHCSWEVDKARSTATLNVDGKCIMFHQQNYNCKLVFCPECATLVKAQALEKFHELKE